MIAALPSSDRSPSASNAGVSSPPFGSVHSVPPKGTTASLLWVVKPGSSNGENTSPKSPTNVSDTESSAEDVRPDQIRIVSGNHQEVRLGHELNNPLVVEVQDSTGDPLEGVPVAFEHPEGQGVLDVNREKPGVQNIRFTNRRGRAQADYYRVSMQQTENRVTARVRREGDRDLTATFTVFGRPQLISVTFEEARLDDALRTLAQIADWNLALPQSVNGQSLRDMTVSVKLTQVSALEALDRILEIHGLSRVVYGDVISVVSGENTAQSGIPVIKPEQLENYPGNSLVSVTYRLQHLDAPSFAEQIRGSLITERASVVVNASSNSLVVTDKGGESATAIPSHTITGSVRGGIQT